MAHQSLAYSIGMQSSRKNLPVQKLGGKLQRDFPLNFHWTLNSALNGVKEYIMQYRGKACGLVN
jgi:hypothetical protein